MKAGYKTTEFWTMALTTAGSFIGSAAMALEPLGSVNPFFAKVAAIGTVVPPVLYQVTRGIQKAVIDGKNVVENAKFEAQKLYQEQLKNAPVQYPQNFTPYYAPFNPQYQANIMQTQSGQPQSGQPHTQPINIV